MEKRKASQSKSSELPHDYLQMVCDIFSHHFDAPLKAFNSIQPNSSFDALGRIYSDEVVLAVSLTTQGKLASTTVYASCDFNPKASTPSVQDLLSDCVDAVGIIFDSLLKEDQPERLAQLASESLSSFEDIPLQWTQLKLNQRQIYVKVDKSNLKMDLLTEEWLMKNDPEYQQQLEKNHKQTEKLFITGPKNHKLH